MSDFVSLGKINISDYFEKGNQEYLEELEICGPKYETDSIIVKIKRTSGYNALVIGYDDKGNLIVRGHETSETFREMEDLCSGAEAQINLDSLK